MIRSVLFSVLLLVACSPEDPKSQSPSAPRANEHTAQIVMLGEPGSGITDAGRPASQANEIPDISRTKNRVRSDSHQRFVPVVECGEARGYLNGLSAAGVISGAGATARAQISRGDWNGRLREAQSHIIWSLAKAATCFDAEMSHTVRVVDETGNVLRVQSVSLDSLCHGDTMGSTTWYRC